MNPVAYRWSWIDPCFGAAPSGGRTGPCRLSFVLFLVGGDLFGDFASFTTGAVLGATEAALGATEAALGATGAALGTTGAALGMTGAALGMTGAALGTTGVALGTTGAAVVVALSEMLVLESSCVFEASFVLESSFVFEGLLGDARDACPSSGKHVIPIGGGGREGTIGNDMALGRGIGGKRVGIPTGGEPHVVGMGNAGMGIAGTTGIAVPGRDIAPFIMVVAFDWELIFAKNLRWLTFGILVLIRLQ